MQLVLVGASSQSNQRRVQKGEQVAQLPTVQLFYWLPIIIIDPQSDEEAVQLDDKDKAINADEEQTIHCTSLICWQQLH